MPKITKNNEGGGLAGLGHYAMQILKKKLWSAQIKDHLSKITKIHKSIQNISNSTIVHLWSLFL